MYTYIHVFTFDYKIGYGMCSTYIYHSEYEFASRFREKKNIYTYIQTKDGNDAIGEKNNGTNW